MALENAHNADELNVGQPFGTDKVSKGDDHIRMLKQIMKAEFYQLWKKNRKYSFELGATVVAGDLLFHEATQTYYEWSGTYPVGGYVVPAGSSPTSAGGIGPSKWVVGRPNGVSTAIILSDTPPAGVGSGQLWWNTAMGTIFIAYNDGTSLQWVEAAAFSPSWQSDVINMRSVLTRLALELGFTLVSGSFQEGASVINATQCVWDQLTGTIWKKTDGQPVVVAANSSPTAAWTNITSNTSLSLMALRQGATDTIFRVADPTGDYDAVNKRFLVSLLGSFYVSSNEAGFSKSFPNNWVGVGINNISNTTGSNCYLDLRFGGITRGGVQLINEGGGAARMVLSRTLAGDDTDRRVRFFDAWGNGDNTQYAANHWFANLAGTTQWSIRADGTFRGNTDFVLYQDGNMYLPWAGKFLNQKFDDKADNNSATIGARTAEIAVGGVGSYALIYAISISVSAGSIASGPNLRYTSVESTSQVTGVPPGTWRAMGTMSGTGQKTLFLRIA